MAFHSLLSLAFVCIVYLVTYGNCFTKFQITSTGRLHNIDVNSKEIKELVKDVQKRFNELSGREIVKVINAKGQVVSGFKYILTVQTRPKYSHGPPTQRCTLTIWDRPWLKSRILLEMNCLLIKRFKHMPMPERWIEARISPLVRHAAAFGMTIVNSKCSCFYMKLISKIKRVQTKVFAGFMYKMHVTITDTICENTAANYVKSFRECRRNPKGHSKACNMTIRRQPWRSPPFKLVSTTCF